MVPEVGHVSGFEFGPARRVFAFARIKKRSLDPIDTRKGWRRGLVQVRVRGDRNVDEAQVGSGVAGARVGEETMYRDFPSL